MKKLYVVGTGMGSQELLTPMAVKCLDCCGEIFSFDRIAKLLSHRFKVSTCVYSELMEKILTSKAETVGVMVSGDTGFFSAATLLGQELKNSFEVVNVPGISSMQYLAAKLLIPYEQFNFISLHGRNLPLELLGSIAYNKYTFALTGGNNDAATVLNFLNSKISSGIRVTAGENLSAENQRIITGTVKELAQLSFAGLTVLLFCNSNPQKKAKHFFDKEFARGKAPMTKQEIRWSTIANLQVEEKDIVYDIGAGTGSVAIEAATFANAGAVFAIEKQAQAFEALTENIKLHSAFNVIAVNEEAPAALSLLPKPTKVFIGGSGHKLKEIVTSVFKKNPQVSITINAVTLETLAEAVKVFKGCETNISCINSSGAKQLGGYNLMVANNPVYIITAKEKNNE